MASPALTHQRADVGAILRAELLSAAGAMEGYGEASGGTLRPLHRLQRWCDMVVTQTRPTGELVPLYIVSRLLDDSLDNLAGDFFYDAHSDQLRRQFFRDLVPDLKRLGSIDLADASEWAEVMKHVVERYLATLAALDAYAESHIPVDGGQLA